jgi:hypothetical protein
MQSRNCLSCPFSSGVVQPYCVDGSVRSVQQAISFCTAQETSGGGVNSIDNGIGGIGDIGDVIGPLGTLDPNYNTGFRRPVNPAPVSLGECTPGNVSSQPNRPCNGLLSVE